MNYEQIAVEQAESVARVDLNRPEARNAMGQQMIAELQDYFASIRDDRSVRVVVLGGRGSVFCAGGDIVEMRAVRDQGYDAQLAQATHLDEMLLAVEEAPQVTIARVHGAALGGGVGLICVSDFAFATENASVGLPEVRLGLVPSVISPYVVRRLGPGRARRAMLAGTRLRGADARDAGFVDEIFGDEPALDAAIERLLHELLQGAPGALADTKALLRTVAGRPPRETLAYRAALLSRRQAGEEGQEGMAAFLEKREPGWSREVRTMKDEG